MFGIVEDFINELLAVALEWVGGIAVNMAELVFKFDESLDTVLTVDVFQDLLSFAYSVAVLLVILKVCYKGFMIYVLGRDGDDAVSPREYLKGAGLAVVVMVAFPILYKYLTDITLFVCDKVVEILAAADTEINIAAVAGSLMLAPFTSMAASVVMLVYVVFFIILYFNLMKQGAEIIILRLGIPFAAVGLVNSDSGAFKPYIQQFLKITLTVIVQMMCITLSFKLVLNGHCIYAVVFLILAKSMPALLNQFLLQASAGGGAMQKVSSAAMTVNTIRNFFSGG